MGKKNIMKISVVLSNYNGEAFLAEAIQSVLEQEYADFEFIIVDDGSTDNSREIIQAFADANGGKIIALLECENQGQAAGFNKGFSVSSGEIVAFIDSDDIWMPCKLANLADFVKITGEAGLYQHNLFFIRDGVKTSEVYRPLLYTGDLYAETCQTRRLPNFVPTSGLAFRRAILEKVMPVPDAFRTCADGYLTRTSFCHGRVASVCDAWGYYRVHDANCVYENPQHDNRVYRDTLLVPFLNRYYETIGSELRYPSLVTLKTEKKHVAGEPKQQPAEKTSDKAETPATNPSNTASLEPMCGVQWKAMVFACFWRLANISAYDVYLAVKRRCSRKNKKS
jgi:glycosyltransferase involved in cell wall biosynthesis